MNLSKFEAAKGIILIEKLLIAAVFLAMLFLSVILFLRQQWYIQFCKVLLEVLGLFLRLFGKYLCVYI